MKKMKYIIGALGLIVNGISFASAPPPPAATQSKVSNDLVPRAPETYSWMPFITVSTSPYISLKTAFDASDIWSQQSSMNEDLTLLRYKQDLEHNLQKKNLSLDQRPIIEISGALEGVISQRFNGYDGSSQGDINLSTAELDVFAMASRWASVFMSVQFDNSPPDTGSRVTNSRLYLSRAFATIGDLDVSPFYLTVGQFYLPFGRYSSNMLTTPLTTSLARINDRAFLLGYANKNGFYAEGFVYSGFRDNGASVGVKQGGANLGYKTSFDKKGTFSIGAGAVTNMADSQGMAGTGAGALQFPGFANLKSNTYSIENNVPGGDVHSEISYGPWAIVGEFISALSDFSPQDMTFNGEGAAPKALHTELWRTFKIYDKDYMWGVSYGQTWQALGFNLPKQSYATYVRTSFWKNTVEIIEFRHDQDYSTDDVATAAIGFGNFINQGTGKSRNTLLAQIGVYF